MSESRFPPIAVIGLGALFPGSPGKAGFWSDILAGRDNISEVPSSHWLADDYYDPNPAAPDKTYCRRGGFLSPIAFDPLAFGIPPSTLPATDTAQLLALMVARQTLDDASRTRHTPVDTNRTSVILGVASSTELCMQMNARLQQPIWRKSLREAGISENTVQEICGRIADHYVPWQEASFPGLLGNVVAGRIANRLDLGGSNFVTDAACASSLAAIQAGMRELILGESDLVLTGGVDALNDILMFMCFSKTPAFSVSGDCRPFAEAADGTIIGEGLGMLALRRLEDAERDGDAIYAVIRGMGSSSDGRASSVYAPRPEGQAKALQSAYNNAGYSPATVELVEAHGTATHAGDAAEFRGLCTIFGSAGEQTRNWCALGSVKSQIGHTKAAAGAAGLIKAVLALHHKVLPPTIKVDKANPTLHIDDTPFYINTEARPWVRGPDHPRRASVSSFGFGGSNFHMTVEEYKGVGQKPPRLRSWPCEMIPLSADSKADLAAVCRAIASRAESNAPLASLACEAQANFDANKSCRIVATVAATAPLIVLLNRAAQALESNNLVALQDPDIAYGEGSRQEGKLAFLFPGQGSQYLGMGADLAMAFPQAMAVWDMVAGLPDFVQDPLHQITFPRTMLPGHPRQAQEAQLMATVNAQPGLAAVSLAQLRLLTTLGLRPDAVAGHSFGEVTALAAAGVLSEARLMEVARIRGRLMAEAASHHSGAMLAVTGDRTRIFALLDAAAINIVLANDNAPNQIVLAGDSAAIERASDILSKAGIDIWPLPVATAFHSPIVASSCAPFRAALAQVPFDSPTLPVQANATTALYPESPDAIRDQLAEQLGQPVQFRGMIDALYAEGVRYFVEVGSGHVLSGLVSKCLDGRPHRMVALDDKLNGGLRGWWRGLAHLLADGYPLNLQALTEATEAVAEPMPAPAHAVMISGANYGRLYPSNNDSVKLPSKPPKPVVMAESPAPPLVSQKTSTIQPAVTIKPTTTTQPIIMQPSIVSKELPPLAKPISVKQSDHENITAFHRETLAVHQHYQEMAAESHRNFLAFAAHALAQLDSELPSTESSSGDVVAKPAILSLVTKTTSISATPPTEVVPTPIPARLKVTPPILTDVPATPTDHTALLRRIIAEKTGYPPDMLDLDMEMEAGLGIDSIKQVEILSALQEALPELLPIKPTELASLRRLRDIAERLGSASEAIISTKISILTQPSEMFQAAIQPPPQTTSPITPTDHTALLRRIIAEKTGYPPDMLDLDMEMEAGLGIDSIKQVEILSALQEALPDLPPIKPTELASLRRLRDIAERLGSTMPVEQLPTSTSPLAAPPITPTDHIALLRRIIAEKTGYPPDMLDLDMEMEASLGIDSIKQVEILSALQEALPDLPPIKPAELAGLRRLRDIAERLGSTSRIEEASLSAKLPLQTQTSAALYRLVPRLISADFLGFSMRALASGSTVFVTNEVLSIAENLATALIAQGISAQVVDIPPPNASAVISLAGLACAADPEQALALHLRALRAARIVARSEVPENRLFITLQATGGTFGLTGDPGVGAWGSGVAAIAKTAALEWPGASVKAIDLADPNMASTLVLRELLDGGPELEVGFNASGQRLGIMLHEEVLNPTVASAPLQPQAVLLVSGGARGVTAQCASALALAHNLRLVLFGRSDVINWPLGIAESGDVIELTRALTEVTRRDSSSIDMLALRQQARDLAAAFEARQSLAELAHLGIEARYLTVDVTNSAALAEALMPIRQEWGAIAGIIHGAGVLVDRHLTELEDADFELVFKTKVAGFASLLAVTKDDPLQLLVVFSSIAARYGNPGQAAYAAANEVLNKMITVERSQRDPSCLLCAFNWGPWDGGMVDSGLKAHFTQNGVALIPKTIGATFFVNELAELRDVTEIVVAASNKAPPRHLHMTRKVGGLEQPYLQDHLIKDRAVLPIVLPLEWACRMGQTALLGDGDCFGLRDLQILSGLTFAKDLSEPSALTFEMTPPHHGSDGLEMNLVLKSPDGRARYRTTFLAMPEPWTSPFQPATDQMSDWPCTVAEAYADKLFHGQMFSVISALETVSKTGGSAMLRGIADMNWPGEAWLTDPALLDGGMQLGVLWSSCLHQRLILPQRIGSYRRYASPIAGEAVRCSFRVRPMDSNRINFDLHYAMPNGTVIAEIRDAEFYGVDA
jgi:acyl transferase domain-containing protein